MALLGAGLGLFGLALLVLTIANIAGGRRWIHHEPLSWLLHDLGSGNMGSSALAWVEIQRRLDAKQISEADQAAIVDQILSLDKRGLGISNGHSMLDYVGDRYLDQKLTAAQADSFFAGMLKVDLLVRPLVGAKNRVPYSIRGTGIGADNWWLRVSILAGRVDDGPIQSFGNGGTGGPFSGWATANSFDPVAKPGKHRLHLKVELATNANRLGALTWKANAAVARKVTQDLWADFQVMGGQTPIAGVAAPPAAVLQALLKPSLNASNPSDISVNVDAAPLPVDAAFDVFLRFDDREYPAGGISFHAGMQGGYLTCARDIPTNVPANADVILRSSPEVARQTIDLTQIWSGQIIYPYVPLVGARPKFPPTTAPISDR